MHGGNAHLPFKSQQEWRLHLAASQDSVWVTGLGGQLANVRDARLAAGVAEGSGPSVFHPGVGISRVGTGTQNRARAPQGPGERVDTQAWRALDGPHELGPGRPGPCSGQGAGPASSKHLGLGRSPAPSRGKLQEGPGLFSTEVRTAAGGLLRV